MNRRIIIVFLVVFTNLVGSGVIIPIIPLYVYEQLDATELQSSLVISSFFIAQIIGAPLLGRWSDRIGRRPVLIISQIGTVASYLILLVAIPLGEQLRQLGVDFAIGNALVIVYAARLLDGLTGGNVSVAQAYASDISAPEERTRILGIVGGAIGLGFMLGPAYGGWLATYNLSAPFVGAAVITGATLLMTLFMLPESLPAAERGSQTVSDRSSWETTVALLRPARVKMIMLIALLTVTGFAAMQSNLTLYIYLELFWGEPVRTVGAIAGFVVAAMGLLAAIGQLALLPPFLRALGEARVTLIGVSLLLLSLLGFDVAADISRWAFFLFIIPLAFGYALTQPSLQGLLTQHGTERTNGQLLGLFQSINSIAYTIGPLIGGAAFQEIGPYALFLASAGLVFVAGILAIRLIEPV